MIETIVMIFQSLRPPSSLFYNLRISQENSQTTIGLVPVESMLLLKGFSEESSLQPPLTVPL
jgi:hypothetical protein